MSSKDLVLLLLPLIFLIVVNAKINSIILVYIYCFKDAQKGKSKCATILFVQNNPKLIDFYTRYGPAVNYSTYSGIPAFFILVMYALWLFFWVDSQDSLHRETLRATLIHLGFWFFIILYWFFFLKHVVRLEKIKREIKSQTLIFDKHLNEHKIFSLLPCGTRIGEMQVRFYKYVWKRLKRRIGNNEKITGTVLLKFLIANNLVINIMTPYILSNRKELDLNINSVDANSFFGTPNLKFKVAQEQLTACDVLEIVRDYFSSITFESDFLNKSKLLNQTVY